MENFRFVLKVFCANKALILAAALLAAAFLPHGAGYKINSEGPLNPMAQWDGEAYLTIAQKGYVALPDGRSLNNFLPLYPFAVRVAGFVVGDLALAGIFLSAVFSLAASYYLFLIARRDFGFSAANKSVVLLLFFPTSFFFAAVYTESMFLAFVLASFYYARKGNWLLAGALAAPLPFIRIVGITFWVVLLAEYVHQKNMVKERRLNLDSNVIGIGIALAGVLLFFVFSAFITGSALGYASQQNLWTRSINLPHKAIIDALQLLFFREGPVLAVYSVWNISVLALFTGTLFYAVRKLSPSYPLYMIFVMAFPLLSSTLEGFSRFILVCFPSFIIMGRVLDENKKFYLPVLLVSAALLVVLTARFATGAVATVIG